MTAPDHRDDQERDQSRSVVDHQDEAQRNVCSEHSSRAALICYRDTGSGPITAEWTYWESVNQAREAEAELAHPCGPLCVGIHSAVRLDSPPDPRRWRGLGRRPVSP